MKTKIVYVLVSEETDYYYEMVLLSLYSLRLYHPKDNVELVMDEATYQRLIDKKAAILDDVTPIVVPIPSEYSVLQSSRYLKTMLRELIKGDFLYLDCDTIICESLEDIDTQTSVIGMVADEIGDLILTDKWCLDMCNKAGFTQLKGKPWYNGGVLYVKDEPAAHLLFNTWHQLWKKSVLAGVSQDQPALCQANYNLNFPIQRISDIWNYQIKKDNLRGTKIFHYIAQRKKYMYVNVLQYIKDRGFIDKTVDKLACNPLTIGYSIYFISHEQSLQYLFSDQFNLYDKIPRLYKISTITTRILSKLYIIKFHIKRNNSSVK